MATMCCCRKAAPSSGSNCRKNRRNPIPVRLIGRSQRLRLRQPHQRQTCMPGRQRQPRAAGSQPQHRLRVCRQRHQHQQKHRQTTRMAGRQRQPRAARRRPRHHKFRVCRQQCQPQARPRRIARLCRQSVNALCGIAGSQDQSNSRSAIDLKQNPGSMRPTDETAGACCNEFRMLGEYHRPEILSRRLGGARACVGRLF